MVNVKHVAEDGLFQGELQNAGVKLVVVDFTATWCGPCQRIGPVFAELSGKYGNAVFLKVDVDECPETAAGQGVTAMPTFMFFKNKVKLDKITGADPSNLESKIKQYYGEEGGESDVGIQGQMDLLGFLNKSGSECLNEADDHPFAGCLETGPLYLESDCDEQLIMSMTFNQPIKLHSIKFCAPKENGPKVVKIFINQPNTLDFDQADKMEPVQQIEFEQKDLTEGNAVPLRYVKFQNVQNLQIFVKNNQGGTEVTRIDYMGLIGSPLSTTNMQDFKRVAGKKGESH